MKSIWQRIWGAFIGTIITSVVHFLFISKTPASQNWTSHDWFIYVQAALAGGIIGWAYQLASDLQTLTKDAISRLETATLSLDYQNEPLKMILSSSRHLKTLRKLIEESIKTKYRYIPYVSVNAYLQCLTTAISQSTKYEGVQRNSVRWFRNNNDGITQQYLEALRDEKMNQKVRIFLLDEKQEEAMTEDLANSELMKYYWDYTGNVETYWITISKLVNNYPEISIPNDFALYDDELLIQYDFQTKTLFFDIVPNKNERSEIFNRLVEQKNTKALKPFIKIEPPKA
jgi:hypothetical protein